MCASGNGSFVFLNLFRLIEQNAQDPVGLYRLVKYLKNRTPELAMGVSVFFLLFIVIGSFPATLQASDVQRTLPNALNSQRLNVLAPQYTIEIPEPIGGPDDIVVEDGALLASIGVTDGEPLRSIEDTGGMSIYVVREGDTLSEIAELFDVSINTIKWENNIENSIRPGQELRILPVTGVSHTIKKGETYAKIAAMYDVELEDITVFNDLDPNNLKVGEKIIVPNGIKKSAVSTNSSSKPSSSSGSSTTKPVSGYYIRPTSGPITSRFGPRSGTYHYGIDFGSPTGTPIVAAASGTVLKVGCGSGYGNCLVIQHDNGTQTLYAHASKLYVGAGTKVKQGQKIAAVGSTGHSTGPHLHFEIIDSKTQQKKNPNSIFK